MASVPCGSCGAAIEFAYKHPEELHPEGHPKAGLPKTAPIDYRSVGDPEGTLATWRDDLGVLRYRALTKANPDLGPGEKRAKSHFAVCDQADQWRSRRKAKT